VEVIYVSNFGCFRYCTDDRRPRRARSGRIAPTSRRYYNECTPTSCPARLRRPDTRHTRWPLDTYDSINSDRFFTPAVSTYWRAAMSRTTLPGLPVSDPFSSLVASTSLLLNLYLFITFTLPAYHRIP